jgi:membrane associated rhomboid family serine protease
MQQIRRTVGDRYISGIVRRVNTATETSSRPCPFCTTPMKWLQLPNPPLDLESCRTCSMVWFDPGKFEQLPVGAVDTPEDALARALEAEAKWKIEQAATRSRGLYGQGAPDEWWKWPLAILGLPVKVESPEISKRPWATWSLAAVITLISFIAFFNLESAVQNFGFIPAEWWRYGGLTFLTCFFLHAGFGHLLGNLYFFLLFSGEVEEHLGHWRLLALTFLSTFVGGFFQLLATPHSTIPCIGASGGISGVMVFYALQFPKGTLAFFFWRFGWIHLPAWCAFALWLLLQLLNYSMQRRGFSFDNVGYMAHFGGVTTGFLLWLRWRKLKNDQTEVVEQ